MERLMNKKNAWLRVKHAKSGIQASLSLMSNDGVKQGLASYLVEYDKEWP